LTGLRAAPAKSARPRRGSDAVLLSGNARGGPSAPQVPSSVLPIEETPLPAKKTRAAKPPVQLAAVTDNAPAQAKATGSKAAPAAVPPATAREITEPWKPAVVAENATGPRSTTRGTRPGTVEMTRRASRAQAGAKRIFVPSSASPSTMFSCR
jgi:hypothetical protein